jgi:hypothetical protein
MPRSRQRLMQGLLVAAMLALAGLAVLHFREAPPPSLPTVEFSIAPPEGVRPSNLSLSPDGRYLALSAFNGGSLWLRALDSDEWRELEGTAGARFPFWSPDSTQVGFFADGRLKKIPRLAASSDHHRPTTAGGPAGRHDRADAGGIHPNRGSCDARRRWKEIPLRRFPHCPDGRHFSWTVRPAGHLPGFSGGPLDACLPTNPITLQPGARPGQGLLVREDALMAHPLMSRG